MIAANKDTLRTLEDGTRSWFDDVQKILPGLGKSDRTSLETNKGYALFCGKDSHFNTVHGLSNHEFITFEDLKPFMDFYRGQTSWFEVVARPGCAPSLIQSLVSVGAEFQQWENILYRNCKQLEISSTDLGPGFRIEEEHNRLGKEHCLDAIAAGFGIEHPLPDSIVQMNLIVQNDPKLRVFSARYEGRPVGGAMLRVSGDQAILAMGGVIKEFRGTGLHKALVEARIQAAKDAGCETAFYHASPGSSSQRNSEKFGFQVLCTEQVWIIRP